MKLNLKSIKGQFYNIEIEETAVVADLKKKIEEVHSFPAESLNLVFAGKVLTDEKTLAESGVTENAAIVFFTKKVTPAKKDAPPAVAPPPAATQATETAPIQTPVTAPTQTTQPPVTPAQPVPVVSPQAPIAAQQPPAARGQATGQGFVTEAAVNDLVAMGFEKTQAEAALRAAYGDTSTAVSYLTDGIPEDHDAQDGDGIDPAALDGMSYEQLQQMAQGHPGGGAPGAGGQLPLIPGLGRGTGQPNPLLQQLRNHPQLPVIRQAILSDPNSIQLIIQQLAQTQPQLAQAIVANPEEFLQVIMGGAIPTPQQGLPQDILGGFGTGVGGQPGGGQAGGQPGSTTFGGQRVHQTAQGLAVELTDDDKANVAQIREMTGSSMNAAVQAYLACDKNVEAAINFLFDS